VAFRRHLIAVLASLTVFTALVPPVLSAPHPQATTARLVRRVVTTKKVVSLTFDDGPTPVATPLLLDYLKHEKIRTTFFPIGQEASQFPHLVAREVAEGHDVGNHGMHHKALGSISEKAAEEEIRAGEEAIVAAGAPKPIYYRLPKGIGSRTALSVLGRRGYTVISWTVDTRDYQRRTVEALVDDVMKGVKPGSIILFHDGPGKREATLAAVKRIVPRLRAQGYTFVPVSQLLRAPAHT